MSLAAWGRLCPLTSLRRAKFGHSGPAVDLLKEFGLSAENIEATVKEVLGK